MAFYDLSAEQRKQVVSNIHKTLEQELDSGRISLSLGYFEDEDTYIRKTAYQELGKIYFSKTELRTKILNLLREFAKHEDYRVRQTAINSAGEIGKFDFGAVQNFFDIGLFDQHHSPRNAVIGSVKKMGEVNPGPVLAWAKQYLKHEDKEIRREICHGIELRGRKYPEDILPILKKLQFDQTSRVKNTLIHVLGQIAYKKGCLEKVVTDLKTWENKDLVNKALEEIIDVHERYKNFSFYTKEQAREYIHKNF